MGENPDEVLDIYLDMNANKYTVKVNTLEGNGYRNYLPENHKCLPCVSVKI